MIARDLTKARGGDWCGHYGLLPGPGHSRRDRSLKVWDGDDGDVKVHSFAGDPWQDCRRYLGLDDDRSRPSRCREVSARAPGPDAEGRAAYAKRIWAESQPAAGSLVETYLRTRGITIEPPPPLRFHGAAKHGPTGLHLPAMIAAVTTWPGREVAAIHRTFLRLDGQDKAAVVTPKMMLGRCAGGAVRLAPAGDELVLAEGIETALSVLQATGKPTWATLSTSGLKAVVLPPEVRTVIIAADGDEPGLKAAEEAAARLYRGGLKVKIARPPGGYDYNDLLMLPENVTLFPGRREAAHG